MPDQANNSKNLLASRWSPCSPIACLMSLTISGN
jgi:hypothetical protein